MGQKCQESSRNSKLDHFIRDIPTYLPGHRRKIICLLPVLICAIALVSSPATAQDSISDGLVVDWQPFQPTIDSAAANGKKILLDIWAPWCGWCTRLQNEVYTDQDVLHYLQKHFEIARVNIDDEESVLTFQDRDFAPADLAFGLGATGTPTTVFLNSKSEYITRLPGFIQPDEFLTVLKYIASEAYLNQSFLEFADQLD